MQRTRARELHRVCAPLIIEMITPFHQVLGHAADTGLAIKGVGVT
ncbi:hypothetical protein ACJ6WE_40070 [Streptomyces sp. MMS24-I31]